MGFRFRLLILACGVLACAGCSTWNEFQSPYPDSDPDALLAARLEALRGRWVQDHDDLVWKVPPENRREIEDLARFFPNHPDIHFVNALLARQTGERVKAQQHLDALFAIQPVHPEGAILRSRLAVEEGNLPFALRFLEQQIRLAPGHAGLREAYASVLFLRNRWDEAELALLHAQQLGAPAWRVAYHRGLVAEMSGRLEQAAHLYYEALLEKPDFQLADSRLAGLKALD